MKKYLLLAGVCLLFAAPANAADFNPYIGFDLGGAKIKTTGKYLSGSENVFLGNLNIGAKFNDFLGMEVSAQASGDADVKGLGDLSYSSIGIDAVVYLPLCRQFELFALGGVGYYNFELELDHKYHGWDVHYTQNETALRGGFGLQYNINDNWTVRGMARYHHIDNKYFDYIEDITVGLRYRL